MTFTSRQGNGLLRKEHIKKLCPKSIVAKAGRIFINLLMKGGEDMSVDLNKIREKLKKQRPIGLTKEGQLTDKDPHNDGTEENSNGQTTLTPQRFFVI